ncbi:MAG: flagellar biosynthetic protein FliR [Sedimentisphaerales bacterium]
MDAIIIEKLLGFAMVMTRISAFFLIAPVFGTPSIPVTIKVAVTILLSIFFSLINPAIAAAHQVSAIQAILLLGSEATYGLALGIIASVLFSTVQLAGRIAEDQMGLTMAEILDPLTGEQGLPVATLLELIFTIAFLAANGHHLLLKVLHKSFELFPPGKIPSIAALTGNIYEATAMMLAAGLQLAAPILAALLMLMFILAILARIVPDMDIFFISFPLKIALGFVMLIASVPFIDGFVSETAKMMAKLLPL